MWLNPYEEKIMGPFVEFVCQHKNDVFLLTLNDDVAVEAEYFNSYESENGLELSDEGYEEFWSYDFIVTKVIKDDSNRYKAKDIICVDYHCVPVSYSVIEE